MFVNALWAAQLHIAKQTKIERTRCLWARGRGRQTHQHTRICNNKKVKAFRAVTRANSRCVRQRVPRLEEREIAADDHGHT